MAVSISFGHKIELVRVEHLLPAPSRTRRKDPIRITRNHTKPRGYLLFAAKPSWHGVSVPPRATSVATGTLARTRRAMMHKERPNLSYIADWYSDRNDQIRCASVDRGSQPACFD
jgi:hypothetical protein